MSHDRLTAICRSGEEVILEPETCARALRARTADENDSTLAGVTSKELGAEDTVLLSLSHSSGHNRIHHERGETMREIGYVSRGKPSRKTQQWPIFDYLYWVGCL